MSFQVSFNFLNDEEQTTAQITSLGYDVKNLRLQQQEHRLFAGQGKSRTVDQIKWKDKMQHNFSFFEAQMDITP